MTAKRHMSHGIFVVFPFLRELYIIFIYIINLIINKVRVLLYIEKKNIEKKKR